MPNASLMSKNTINKMNNLVATRFTKKPKIHKSYNVEVTSALLINIPSRAEWWYVYRNRSRDNMFFFVHEFFVIL